MRPCSLSSIIALKESMFFPEEGLWIMYKSTYCVSSLQGHQSVHQSVCSVKDAAIFWQGGGGGGGKPFCQSRSRFKQRQVPPLKTNVLRFFVNF